MICSCFTYLCEGVLCPLVYCFMTSFEQIGLMLQGTAVENTLIGGPAHNSKEIATGDVILKIDEQVVTTENIKGLVIGNDLPGTPVSLSIAKGGPKVSILHDHDFSASC